MSSSRPILSSPAVNTEFFISRRHCMGFTRRLEHMTLCCCLVLTGLFQNRQSTPRVKEVSS
jgi:hypothetical protein